MELKKEITQIAQSAQESARFLAVLSSLDKKRILREMAASLIRNKAAVLGANKKDIILARRQGMSQAFIERLALDAQKIREMADSMLALAGLRDPVGEVIKDWIRPNGLRIRKVRVPIGVIAIIL